jgi:hypothetical protein
MITSSKGPYRLSEDFEAPSQDDPNGGDLHVPSFENCRRGFVESAKDRYGSLEAERAAWQQYRRAERAARDRYLRDIGSARRRFQQMGRAMDGWKALAGAYYQVDGKDNEVWNQHQDAYSLSWRPQSEQDALTNYFSISETGEQDGAWMEYWKIRRTADGDDD